MAASIGSQRQSQRSAEPKSACRILVLDPKLHPTSNFTTYKVIMHVVPESIFQEEYQIIIFKRFSDFLRLHRQLSDLHTKLQRRDPFPTMPEASYFNRFEPAVIEERRQAAQTTLQFCADQPHLRQHAVFRAFFQTGVRTAGPPPPLPPPAQAPTAAAASISSSNFGIQRSISTAAAAAVSSSPEISSSSPTEASGIATSPPAYTRSISATSGLPDVSEFDPFVVQSSAGESHLPAASTSTRGEQNSDLLNGDLMLTLHSEQTPIELEDEMLMSRLQSLRVVTNNAADSGSFTDEFGRPDEAGLPPAPPPLATQEPLSPLLGASGFSYAPPYLAEAANHVTEAQRHESAGDFALAFAEYKAGVEILLGGVQLDSDTERRADVKRKTEQYLRRAEAIYDKYLDAASAAIQKITRPHKELQNYAVIGTAESVILVINRFTQQRFVIKSVCKSVCDMSGFPVDVAFMCRLRAVFVSDWTQYLLLDCVPGGRLYDFVRRHRSDDGQDFDARCRCDVSDAKDVGIESAKSEKADDDDGGFVDSRTTGLSILNSSVRVFHSVASGTTVTPQQRQQQQQQQQRSKGSLTCKAVRDSSICDQSYAQLFNNYLASSAAHETGQSAAAATTASAFVELGGGSVDTSKDVDSDDGLRSHPAVAAGASSSNPAGRYRGRALSSVFAQIIDSVLQQQRRGGSAGSQFWQQQQRPVAALPESCVRQWGAELLTGLAQLHSRGLYFGCLLPSDVLLGDRGHLRLTYRYRRTRLGQALRASPYCAPEWRRYPGATPVRPQVGDWWSLGCHLLLMLTGDCICGAVQPPPPLPQWLSPEARHLLDQLLCQEPRHRLGGGSQGADEIRQHAFFRGVDWVGIAAKAF